MKKLIKKILKESEEDFKWISPKVDLDDTIIYFDKGLTPTQWVKLKNIFRSEGVNYINGDLNDLDNQVLHISKGGFRIDKEKTILWINFSRLESQSLGGTYTIHELLGSSEFKLFNAYYLIDYYETLENDGHEHNIIENVIDKVKEILLQEAKKKKKTDRCTRIAKRKYDVWPSAYASGAVVKCRQGKIWKNEDLEYDLDTLMENNEYEELLNEEPKKDFSKEKEKGLHGWFERRGGKGKSKGWVDCNTCRDGKCKSCGRQEGEKRSKYPRCRPTPAQCKGYKKLD